MANEKIFQSRIQLKHDIEENWSKATNFIPKVGEIIIYDIDENNSIARFKIGDDTTDVNSLPFVSHHEVISYLPQELTEEQQAQVRENIGAGEPQIQADWNQIDENAIDYIKNRPFGNETIEADFIPTAEIEFSSGEAYVSRYTSGDNPITFKVYYLSIDDVTTQGTMIYMNNPIYDYVCEFDNGWVYGDYGSIYAPNIEDGTHTVRMFTMSESIKTIDNKYLDIPIVDWESTQGNSNSHLINTPYAFQGEGIKSIKLCNGNDNIASGDYSLVEGSGSTASGDNAHAEGSETIAAGFAQHVQGECNIEDTESIYAHIVGNGTASARSNAHTLDWEGNAWYQGDVYVGSTSGINKDEGSQRLITEEDAKKIVYNCIYLADTENNHVYKLEIKNGTLTTSLDIERALQDFTYTTSEDGTYTITGWKETLNGESSTELVVPETTMMDIEI